MLIKMVETLAERETLRKSTFCYSCLTQLCEKLRNLVFLNQSLAEMCINECKKTKRMNSLIDSDGILAI